MAAPAGLEPANAGVKVLCLTSLATRLYEVPNTGTCASIQCPPIIKQTIGTIALPKSMLATPHFTMGLFLQETLAGHLTSTALLIDTEGDPIQGHRVA